MITKLKFSNANSKLQKLEKKIQQKVVSFSLPSGFTCPGALDCLSKASRETGKIQDGEHTKFRCYMASAEALYPALRAMVWHNFETIRALKNDYTAIADLICNSLPDYFNVMRIHTGGDFFSQAYFDAWLEVAKRNPTKRFYAYSKALNFVAKRLAEIPDNFVITASRGGKYDYLINEYNLKCAEVVYSQDEAKAKGLEIDTTDYLAAFGKNNFSLLIHGTQPAKTFASKGLAAIRQAAKI